MSLWLSDVHVCQSSLVRITQANTLVKSKVEMERLDLLWQKEKITFVIKCHILKIPL